MMSTSDHVVQSPEAPKAPSPFTKGMAALILSIENAARGEYGHLDRGEVSKLRRMETAAPVMAFWKVRTLANDAAGEEIIGLANADRWALVVKGIAMMSPLANASIEPGHALREAGWSSSSDLRISRLLKADDETFEDYALGAIRFLAAKGKPMNWLSFARFLVFRDQTSRNRLARDFYSNSTN